MGINQYKSINGTATTASQSVYVRVGKIKLIANDNLTGGDLLISLDGDFSANNYMVLKPGESFRNFEELECDTLYYKASTGTVTFRFIGTIA